MACIDAQAMIIYLGIQLAVLFHGEIPIGIMMTIFKANKVAHILIIIVYKELL